MEIQSLNWWTESENPILGWAHNSRLNHIGFDRANQVKQPDMSVLLNVILTQLAKPLLMSALPCWRSGIQSYLKGPILRAEQEKKTIPQPVCTNHSLRTKRETTVHSQSFHFCAVLLCVLLMEMKHLAVRGISRFLLWRCLPRTESTMWM